LTHRQMVARDERGVERGVLCVVTETEGFGGTEVHTLDLIGLLIGRGHSITLIQCGHRQYDERIRRRGWDDRVTMIHTDLRVNAGWRALREWRKLLSGLEKDTLLFPKGHPRLGSLAFLLLCRRSFRKVFLIEHLEPGPVPARVSGLHFGFVPGLGLWWFRRRGAEWARSRCADRIIAVSELVRDRFVRDYFYPPSKVHVVRNGVSTRDFARNANLGNGFRARHRIGEGVFVFGMITRLNPVKGIDIALRALRLMLLGQDLRRPVHLVVAGEGADREKLEELAKELGVRGHVTFAGFLREPREALSAYDALLFPSRLEGLPLGLLEGMAAGCIPIVTSISGMPEVVNSAEIGWVVPPESPGELSTAMVNVATMNDEALDRLRRGATRRIQESFELAACHQRIVEIFDL